MCKATDLASERGSDGLTTFTVASCRSLSGRPCTAASTAETLEPETQLTSCKGVGWMMSVCLASWHFWEYAAQATLSVLFASLDARCSSAYMTCTRPRRRLLWTSSFLAPWGQDAYRSAVPETYDRPVPHKGVDRSLRCDPALREFALKTDNENSIST